MPKPVQKKAAPQKPAAKKRPSSDPNRRAHQMLAAMTAKEAMGQPPWKEDVTVITVDTKSTTPPHGDPFEEMFRKRMSELGKKGGKASSAKRMEMPEKKRKALASNAAKARWAKKRPVQS